jgi:hypothetical protein
MRHRAIQWAVFYTLVCIAVVCSMTAGAVERSAVIIGSRVVVHAAPDGDATVEGYVNEGMEVPVLGRSETTETRGEYTDYWYHVSFRGGTGWVYGQFLTLGTGKSPLARIFTAEELEEHCLLATENLSRVRDEALAGELVALATRFLDELEQCEKDPILSTHADVLRGFRSLALYYQALGYAKTGQAKEAKAARDELSSSSGPGTLPNGAKVRDLIEEIDRALSDVAQ